LFTPFIALHESAIGTSRRSRVRSKSVAIGGEPTSPAHGAARDVLPRSGHPGTSAATRSPSAFVPSGPPKSGVRRCAVETARSSPEELATWTGADADKWGRIIKRLGITPQ